MANAGKREAEAVSWKASKDQDLKVGPENGRFGREERRGVEENAGGRWVRPLAVGRD
jgi:hypothetical protein